MSGFATCVSWLATEIPSRDRTEGPVGRLIELQTECVSWGFDGILMGISFVMGFSLHGFIVPMLQSFLFFSML